MKEGQPANKLFEDIRSPLWDVVGVATALRAKVSQYNDVVAGQGYKMRVGDSAELQLFPENHIISFRRPYFMLNMAHIINVEPLKGKVAIEAGDASSRSHIVLRP